MSARIAVIWNPSKTEREALEEPLASLVNPDDEIAWFETTVDDPGQDAAARALETSPEVIVAAGGDGTVRAVAEHLADAKVDVELAIVPLGTGNLLARNLDVPINDISGALTRALRGVPRPVDVGWVDVDLEEGTERHGFVVMIGFGIDAQMIAETDEELKSKAGWLAYVESLGRALSASEVVPFRLTVDEEPGYDEKGHTLLIANCGTLQGGITLLPDADPSDGQLDFLVLNADGLGQWLDTMKTMVWDNGLKRLFSPKEKTTSSDTVVHGQARSIRVDLPAAHAFEIDGEDIGRATGFTVTLQPAALSVR